MNQTKPNNTETKERPAPADRKKEDDSAPKPDEKRDGENDQGKTKEEEKKEPEKPPFYKRPVPMLILSVLLVLAIVAGVIWWLYARQFESTDDAFVDGNVIAISPNVSATVLAIHIDDNWRMKKGDLLVELDPRDFQVVVDQMQASLVGAQERVREARVQLDVAKANVLQSQAELVVAQTNAENARRDYERFAHLKKESRSQQQLDNVNAAMKSNDAQVEQARAKLTASQANVADAEVGIKTADATARRAQADLDQARINLGYCKIWAPTDGIVTRRNEGPGIYAQKGDPLFSLVPTEVWVTANYKETQLGLMRVGQDVTITVDTYSGRVFHGKVNSIQNGTGSKFTLLPPENATGNYVKIVQRVPVKIVFDPGELENTNVLLAPGMSVEPKVKVR
jgi:membrane fusion protein (multidrug efflux system)